MLVRYNVTTLLPRWSFCLKIFPQGWYARPPLSSSWGRGSVLTISPEEAFPAPSSSGGGCLPLPHSVTGFASWHMGALN